MNARLFSPSKEDLLLTSLIQENSVLVGSKNKKIFFTFACKSAKVEKKKNTLSSISSGIKETLHFIFQPF